MAMEINATVIVQAFNFFVTYVLLRILLFKPAVNALQREQKETDHLQSMIQEREKRLAHTAEQKQVAWQKMQEQFAKASPPVRQARITHRMVEPTLEPHVLTSEQIEHLAHEVEQAVIKKVSHV